ncbi:serine/threonine protein kinase, partial [Streptomyces sp. NPDC000151]
DHQPRQPQQPAPRPPREPRPPRQRSANPVHIPGLGCLKGCLIMIVLIVVGAWLIWELTPLQDWIGQGRSFWNQVSQWVSDVSDWVSTIGEASKSVGGR